MEVLENSTIGTEHGYGSAIFMAGGLLKKISSLYRLIQDLSERNYLKEEI